MSRLLKDVLFCPRGVFLTISVNLPPVCTLLYYKYARCAREERRIMSFLPEVKQISGFLCTFVPYYAPASTQTTTSTAADTHTTDKQ